MLSKDNIINYINIPLWLKIENVVYNKQKTETCFYFKLNMCRRPRQKQGEKHK